MVNLTLSQCKALLLACPKLDARYYLLGVHFAKGQAEATTGVLALRIPVDMPADLDVIVPRACLEMAVKLKARTVILTFTATHVTFSGVAKPLMEAKYPDIAGVMPFVASTTADNHHGVFDLDLQIICKKIYVELTFAARGPNRPIAWLQEDKNATSFIYEPAFTLCLMPIKS